MINFIDVTKKYTKNGPPALDHIQFDIADREMVGILGHNGAGKTTLFLAASGLLHLDAGEIRINGASVSRDARKVKLKTGLFTDRLSLYNSLKVEECIAFFMGLYRVKDRKMMMRLMEAYGVEPYQKQFIGRLSTGMMKRVSLLISMLHSPEVLFLDEPFSGLDPIGKRDFVELIQDVHRQNKMTTLISSHDLHEIQHLVNQIVVLKKGKVVEQGNLGSLYAQYDQDKRMAVYLSGVDSLLQAALSRSYPTESLGEKQVRVTCHPNALADLISGIRNRCTVDRVDNEAMSLENLYIRIDQK